MTMTPSTSTSPDREGTAGGAPPTVEHVVVPAQVLRRPEGAPPPVPSPRAPQDDAVPSAPAGLAGTDVPGLYTPEPTGHTEPLARWALLGGVLVPPVGIVLGLVALRRCRRRADQGRGLAVAGVVVGGLISAVLVLVVVLSALVGLAGSTGPAGPGSPGTGTSGAVEQTCSGSICTVTARGAPVTIDGVGAGGADGVSVLAVGEGSAVVASPEGPLEVATGTALDLELGTRVVLTQAGGDTVVFVYQR